MMKRDRGVKLKIRFPYEAIIALISFVFCIVICIWQYRIKGDMEYLLIASGALIVLCFFGWLFNNIFKNLEIAGELLTVRYWFGFNALIVRKHHIKGYKIKETYTNQGLDYHIILVPLEGKEIVFIKDSYTNYERLEFYLKNFGIRYIGTENIRSPYKQVIAKIIVLATALGAILFLLVQLLKVNN